MSHLGWSNALSIIPLLAGLTFGSEAYNKSVCEGDSIKLFNSVQIDKSDTVVHLYKNGDTHRSIASFTTNTSSITQANVVMDLEKNIWIINVHTIDQGYYILQYDIRNEKPSTIEIYLSVWVSPALTCKPVITRIGNILTATLLDNSCGNPMASAYWKDCSGLICGGTHVLKLQAGREAGTYYACTTGPALRCARSSDPSSDYCSFIQIEESTVGSKTQTDSDFRKDDLHTWLIPIVIILCAVFVMVFIFGINAWRTPNRRCCTRNPRNKPNGMNPGGLDMALLQRP